MSHKTIVTKILPATSTKPTRVKAYHEGGHSVVIGWADDNSHQTAARALAVKMQWPGNWARSSLPNGDQVFTNLTWNPQTVTVRTVKVGTSAFPTIEDAYAYYSEQGDDKATVDQKLAEGAIEILASKQAVWEKHSCVSVELIDHRWHLIVAE